MYKVLINLVLSASIVHPVSSIVCRITFFMSIVDGLSLSNLGIHDFRKDDNYSNNSCFKNKKMSVGQHRCSMNNMKSGTSVKSRTSNIYQNTGCIKNKKRKVENPLEMKVLRWLLWSTLP